LEAISRAHSGKGSQNGEREKVMIVVQMLTALRRNWRMLTVAQDCGTSELRVGGAEKL
jgi:hypothetical protein